MSQIKAPVSKVFTALITAVLCIVLLSGCSTNPATGKSQFAALMSPAQEEKIGAQEHEKIIAEYGLYDDKDIAAYVSGIGARISKDTERPEVQYKFYVLDSPMVNAFALPGGYIYVTRGLMALANSEAELAAVLAHEVAHVTARHSAERYSRSVVTSLGSTILSTVFNNPGADQALGLGSNLYLSGYSRAQENEADTLGVRYLAQGGYDPKALSNFLNSLDQDTMLMLREKGGKEPVSYFSTHPATPDRVAKTAGEAQAFNQGQRAIGRDNHLKQIDGLTYGDSAAQGFQKGNSFYHPELGFAFDVPSAYDLINQPTQVIVRSKATGAVMIFDIAGARDSKLSADAYLSQVWMKKESLNGLERITVNGLPAATASFDATINKHAATVRLIAIEWQQGRYARYQIALPKTMTSTQLDAIKTATYSFRALSETEKRGLRPKRIKLIAAKSGDTPASLARNMPFNTLQEERFRVLNGLNDRDVLVPGRLYKSIRQ